jgi:hypothetical protein
MRVTGVQTCALPIYRADMRDVKDMLGKIFDKLDSKVDK